MIGNSDPVLSTYDRILEIRNQEPTDLVALSIYRFPQCYLRILAESEPLRFTQSFELHRNVFLAAFYLYPTSLTYRKKIFGNHSK